MIEFEIIQKIKVKTIPEETIRKILLTEIQKQIPEAIITGIEFVIKRNPTRVELDVDAQYGAAKPVTKGEAEVELAVPATPAVTVDAAAKSLSEKVVAEKNAEVLEDLLTLPKVNKNPEPEVVKATSKTSTGSDVADMFKL